MTLILKATANTLLKRKPLQASVLPEDHKQPLVAGREIELLSFERDRDHVRSILALDKRQNHDTWYADNRHVVIYDGDRQVFPKVLPDNVRLDVPYRSQRNNVLNPDGACNVTSLAMVLLFFDVQPRHPQEFPQFEDELYDYTEHQGLSRHNPYDLAKVVEAYGCRDTFRSNSTIENVKEWLADGKPAVIHGYFTDFGHIVTVVGYTSKGFWVHDPYGEWYSWGYDRNEPDGNNTKGKFQHYSYALIRRVCMPDGNLWAHLISA